MSAIIEMILAIVGPLISAWLKSWLDGLLKSVAAKVPEVGAGVSDEVRSYLLLVAARAELWFFQFAKRNLLAHMIATVPPAVASGSLTPAAAAVTSQLAAKVG